LGRADGYNKGKGGSFHSVAPALGFLPRGWSRNHPAVNRNGLRLESGQNGRVTVLIRRRLRRRSGA
jgi:hypothetical protein